MNAHKIIIRSRTEDSAFLYSIFEALEGWAAYSTLEFASTDPFRDLELIVPEDWLSDVKIMLNDLSDIVTILA